MLSNRVRRTGVMNTINSLCGKLYIENTDILAIKDLLWEHGLKSSSICVVVGTGATAISAIYAILSLRCIPIVVTWKESRDKGIKFVWDLRRQFKRNDVYFGETLSNLNTEVEELSF